jgi:hypothetical protein
MFYRIVGVDTASQEPVEIQCDAPDIEGAGRFATEKGVLVERIETDDGSVVCETEPPQMIKSAAPPDPAQAVIMQRAKNLQANSVGCLVVGACVMAVLWLCASTSPKHSGSTSGGTSTTATPAHMVATLDYHGSDAAYEAAVDEVLTRVARKCNSDPRKVGGNAIAARKLLGEAGIIMSLREVLEAMDAAVPPNADWLDVDHAFATFVVARQKQSNTEAITTLRKMIVAENTRPVSSQDSGGGKVNYSLVNTMKDAWRREGWRYKSKAEQAKALILMVSSVKIDSPDPAEREATLDYIERTIADW